jgi:aryl-alcohol dehydrogenase-like predicted oxidoreductase
MVITDERRLGKSGITVSGLGIGVWSWGDTNFWQYGNTHGKDDVHQAFQASLEAGVNFFDSAEIYGNGKSEQLLGEQVRATSQKVVVASKFAPLPYRFSAQALWPALEASLMRLGLTQVDLYQVHWPYTVIQMEDLMKALAEVVKMGKVKAVGVSNYSADQMRKAYKLLESYGIPLASNQVQYNLIYRKPEVNGVLDACRELDVALIAYSPIAQGTLSGKYLNSKPSGPRRFSPQFWSRRQEQYRPLLDVLFRIGKEREKTPVQVALNWLICRDEHIIPIPGAKTEAQARQNAGALGWRLSEKEFREIDIASCKWLK